MCEGHNPTQHRDGKPPWCEKCGLTLDYKIPISRITDGSVFHIDNDIPKLCREIVLEHGVKPLLPGPVAAGVTTNDLYVVWFTYTLGNYKAMISTNLQDDRYYEVTFNREKSEAYVDTYRKTHNIAVTIL